MDTKRNSNKRFEMKKRHEYEVFSLIDKCIGELRQHDYAKATILNGQFAELKERLYGKPIG